MMTTYVKTSRSKLDALNPTTFLFLKIAQICGILQMTHSPMVVISQNPTIKLTSIVAE